MKVYENELLGLFLKRLDGRQVELVETLGEEASDQLRQALAAFLNNQAQNGDGRYVTVEESEHPSPPDFKSVVWRGGAPGRARLLAFNFKNAFTDSALPLFGLILSLFGGPLTWASLPSGLELMQKLWSNLSLLKEPENADAIVLLDALVKAKAKHALAKSADLPSWSETLLELGPASSNPSAALDFLLEKKIVEIRSWGGQAGDKLHPDNRLTVTT